MKVKCVNDTIINEAMWRYRDAPGLQIIFSRRKATCLVGTDHSKNNIDHFLDLFFFSEK